MYLTKTLSRGAQGYVIPAFHLSVPLHLCEPMCSFPFAFPSALSLCAPLLHPIPHLPTHTACSFNYLIAHSVFHFIIFICALLMFSIVLCFHPFAHCTFPHF